MKTTLLLLCCCVCILCSTTGYAAQSYSIGVYYYPGWRSDYINWKDIQGTSDSRSPGRAWPDRVPLLGYYPEEKSWVAEKQIAWAAQYGINFFVYDWYWDGSNPQYDHALQNYLKARNKSSLQFCILWANHFPIPNNYSEFDAMVTYWLNNYFNQPTYYRIDGKPVLFIYDMNQLETNAQKFGETAKSLLARMNSMAQAKGYSGIYCIATTNATPNDDLEKMYADTGLNAYTGWNYVETKGSKTEDYDVMVDAYLDMYRAASQTLQKLPYIATASPGWDSRPWSGSAAPVRTNPTPEKFARMLTGAKQLMDSNARIPKILLIEAWNEFGEGAYIEPTKKWGFSYLSTIRKIFTAAPALQQTTR